jgi:hypothetical protein
MWGEGRLGEEVVNMREIIIIRLGVVFVVWGEEGIKEECDIW